MNAKNLGRMSSGGSTRKRRVRYGVAGLGYISQDAVLPAFAHAKKNAELVALISDDPKKLRAIGKKYGVDVLVDYDSVEECFGEIDALYIGTPNSEHVDLVVRAARAGVHVLCEKPLAVTPRECRRMIDACRKGGVKLMTAYRLHFEAANLKAVEIARSGELGELRLFNSSFTMQVKDPENIRLKAALGGGPLHDIGIYCINAARSLFRDEPESVFAWAANSGDRRFVEVEESVAAVLRFPGARLATFVCSFGAADSGFAQLVGTKGELRLDPAYEFHEALSLTTTIKGKAATREFAKRDQFAAELIYFADCILKDREPEPSGEEGFADVRVIDALHRSLRTGKPVRLAGDLEVRHPDPRQRIDRPAVRKPRMTRAKTPAGDTKHED